MKGEVAGQNRRERDHHLSPTAPVRVLHLFLSWSLELAIDNPVRAL